MSDQVPMPEVLSTRPASIETVAIDRRIGQEIDRRIGQELRARSPYAPRQQPDVAKISELKAVIRTMIHREMRDLVREIFEAHGKIPKPETGSRNVAISVVELADTLDKFAFGD